MSTVLRWAVVTVVTIHGLIHLMGAAKGFGWARINQLTEPIGTAGGVAWLAAAALVLTAAGTIALRARTWWLITTVAAVASQSAIATSWADAKAGTAANAIMLLAAGYGYAAHGPRSFQAEYTRRMHAALAEQPAKNGVVTAADLTHLPPPVADHVRRCGAVGQPRVANFRATIHGRIRSGPSKPWMPFAGEQFNTYGPHPRRLFHIQASMSGLPADVLHVYADNTATMRVNVCSLLPIINAAGPDMDRGETVTVFNDLCVLAPAALVDAPIRWQVLDEHHVRGTFTQDGQTVSAVLVFNDAHDLVDFISNDRLRASPDGRSFTRQRWSTPIHTHRNLGPWRTCTDGEAHWHAPEPENEFPYLEYHLDDITYNTGMHRSPRGQQVAAT
ncbi:DUF6544 family protein [Dactylosporangium sp. NPDC049742]|uniref:DUF6544 family protein n=1 Tax=Dactylosporangium sp. NPDC049742 TaxID=3154737 RepID=UPI003448CEF2